MADCLTELKAELTRLDEQYPGWTLREIMELHRHQKMCSHERLIDQREDGGLLWCWDCGQEVS